MAYPSITAPYGLRPINLIGGQVFAGSTRSIPIGSGNDTSIFYGDVVKLDSSGLLQKEVGTDAATPVGVFLGCTYTDSQYGLTFRQFYTADTIAADITAYVTDDPDALYKVAVVSATTTIGYVNRTAVGNNAVLVQNAGSTLTGNSAVAIDDNTGTTATFPIRIIDVVPETAIAGYPGSYTEVVVKWNTASSFTVGGHQYNLPLGV